MLANFEYGGDFWRRHGGVDGIRGLTSFITDGESGSTDAQSTKRANKQSHAFNEEVRSSASSKSGSESTHFDGNTDGNASLSRLLKRVSR